MDQLLEQMYRHADIVEGLYRVLDEAALCNGEPLMREWNGLQERIGDLTERLAGIDPKCAEDLLRCWEKIGVGQTDFRVLSADIERFLLPAVKNALTIVYPPMETTAGKWSFQKSDVGFFTVRNIENERFIHSPVDPMREAAKLAEKIWKREMRSFHLLGAGLGYLAYQIWEKSKHSVKLYIYEDDKLLLDAAYRLGVLEWIDKRDIEIVNHTDVDSMLKQFLEKGQGDDRGRYISDYKAGGYKDSIYGMMIDRMDFNMRVERICSEQWAANKIKNLELGFRSFGQLDKDYDLRNKKCIIVSAGPSLNDNIGFLKEKTPDMIVICVNTVLKRLCAENTRPDLVAVLDFLPILENHLDGIETFTKEVPLVMPIVASHAFARRYLGPVYCLPDEEETNGFVWKYGGTVSSLALDLAYYFDAKSIYLIGNDLAYPGGINFAEGVAHQQDEGTKGKQEDLYVTSVDGGTVKTNPLYNVYREIIEEQIASHPGTPVINMSRNGAAIKGTEVYSKENV